MSWMNRCYRHVWAGEREAKKAFPDTAQAQIEKTVANSEKSHRGELRVVIEGGMGWLAAFENISSRVRAVALFSNLGVWDTAENSGVLIYILMAEHKLEIVADRGIHAKVGEQSWQDIAQKATAQFKEGIFEAGLIAAIEATTVLLTTHFPSSLNDLNELPNKPVRL